LAGSVNRVILLGRLGKDPEVKYTQSGQALARFSLATDDRRKDESGNWVDQTDWHNIVCFGKQAETAGEYAKKGALVYIEGKLRYRSWDDKETGQKRYMTEIWADRWQFVGPRQDSSAPRSAEPAPTSAAPTASSAPTSFPEPVERLDDHEDLPF
jgi:single-strand DNA-binding protein